MLALAMAPAGALAVADGVGAYRDAIARADRDFLLETAYAARVDRDALIAARAALEALAGAPSVREAKADCDATLRSFVATRPQATLAALTDRDGLIVCASRADALGITTATTSDRDTFWSQGRFTITSLDRGEITRQPVIVATQPVFAADGTVRYALNLSIRSASIGAGDGALRPQERLVVGRDGGPFAPALAATSGSWRPADAMLAARLGPEPVAFEMAGRDGVERVYAAAPVVDDAAWLLAGATPDAVRPGGFAAAAPTVLAPVLMWLAGVFVAYFTIDRLVVRHVVYLSRLARAFGHGRLRLRPKGMETAPKEVGQLAQDMSEMAAKLDVRQRALAEAAETNRVLLLEVYHRVKNNLQMIASLLSLEARRASEPETIDALARVRARVQSVALVHATLYGYDDVGRVRLDRLAEQIVRPMAGGRQSSGEADVDLVLTLDPVLATAERATPFALFLNEAGANAMEHARARSGRARIDVRLSAGPAGGFELTVANDADGVDGEGLPEDALARRLMQGFAQQLGGDLDVGWRSGRHVIRLAAPGATHGPPPSAATAATAAGADRLG